MIPAFFAKTTALFIDDDAHQLRDLNDFLPKTHLFEMRTDPLEGLESINKQTTPQFRCQESLFSDFRFTQFAGMISVIIVDHRMTPIDGIELCRRIKPTFAKKIMLTSYATQKIAVDAFNNKLIDAFLLKTEDNLLETLSSKMEECSLDFFIDLSRSIDGYSNNANPLINERLSVFFHTYCLEKQIVEYCCIHDFYNLLLKDRDGQESHMTIYDSDHIQDLMNTEQARLATDKILALISEHKFAPCFKNTGSPLIPDGNEWIEHLVPLKPVGENLFVATS